VDSVQLETAIRRELSGTFFTMNLDEARSTLTKLPWVRNVALRRQWPQRLEVTVEEHVPFGRWNDTALVDTFGDVFTAEYDGALPQFSGPRESAADVTDRYREATAALAPFGLEVEAVRLSARGGWQIVAKNTTGKIVIDLGRDDPSGSARTLHSGLRTHDRRARARGHADRARRSSLSQRLCGARTGVSASEPARRREGAQTMVRDSKNVIVGLDIGTSKIVAIVAEVTPENDLNIIGLGTQPSRGLKKGVVVNIEATMGSIQRVLEEAELMADCRITDVYTGVAGSHIRSLNSSGMVAIKEKEVTEADIDRVVETAKAVAIPNDQQILHILPQEFISTDRKTSANRSA
jgi:hypothetical protein